MFYLIQNPFYEVAMKRKEWLFDPINACESTDKSAAFLQLPLIYQT